MYKIFFFIKKHPLTIKGKETKIYKLYIYRHIYFLHERSYHTKYQWIKMTSVKSTLHTDKNQKKKKNCLKLFQNICRTNKQKYKIRNLSLNPRHYSVMPFLFKQNIKLLLTILQILSRNYVTYLLYTNPNIRTKSIYKGNKNPGEDPSQKILVSYLSKCFPSTHKRKQIRSNSNYQLQVEIYC